MFGPGLALRGSEGPKSIHKAIESLKFESKNCFKYFMLCLLSFHISSFLLVWIYYDSMTSLIVNFALAIFLYLFVTNGYNIMSKLYIPDYEAVTSQFTNFNQQFESIPNIDNQMSNVRQNFQKEMSIPLKPNDELLKPSSKP